MHKSEGKRAGSTRMVLAAISAAGAVAGAINSVASALNAVNPGRSVILELDNNTNRALSRVSDHHDHGGFEVIPKDQLPPNTAMVFGARSSGFLTGTEGNVVWGG